MKQHMRTIAVLVFAALLAATGSACRGNKQAREDRKPLQPFKPVTYVRTGGLAGTEDRITIALDGTTTTSGRLLGNSTSKLSEFQLLQLARVFEGWETLQESYPAPPEVRDAFTVAITFGDKTVTGSDASANLPEQFKTARRRLEQLARTLPATRPGGAVIIKAYFRLAYRL